MHDSAMRPIIGGKAAKGSGASPSQMGRFETTWLARSENLAMLTNLSGHWIDQVAKRRSSKRVALERKGAIEWTRLLCRSFNANAARLQLHALAYNRGKFLRTLAIPEAIEKWSLTSLREKLIKIGARVVSHGHYVAFQMAAVAISRQPFAAIMQRIAALRSPPMATAT